MTGTQSRKGWKGYSPAGIVLYCDANLRWLESLQGQTWIEPGRIGPERGIRIHVVREVGFIVRMAIRSKKIVEPPTVTVAEVTGLTNLDDAIALIKRLRAWAVSKIPNPQADGPNDDRQPTMTEPNDHPLLTNTDKAVMDLAGREDLEPDEKMRRILAISNAAHGWKSPKWGRLLDITASRVRQLATWKRLQEKKNAPD